MADFVQWPGQSVDEAMQTARVCPLGFYDPFASPPEAVTEAYVLTLAQMAGLNDWLAHLRLSRLVTLEVPEHQNLSKLSSTGRALDDHHLYAFGTYAFVMGDEQAAQKFWRNCADCPRAKVALALSQKHNQKAELEKLLPDPFAQLKLACLLKDVAVLQTIESSAHAKYALALALVKKQERARAIHLLLEAIRMGVHSAADSLFTLQPELLNDEKQLVHLCECGVQPAIVALGRYHFARHDKTKARDVLETGDVLHGGRAMLSLGLISSEEFSRRFKEFESRLTNLSSQK